MLARSLLTALAGAMILSGCVQSPKTEPAPQPARVELGEAQPLPQTFVIRGEMVLGHESRSIQPCGSNSQYWLDISLDDYQRASTLIKEPYEPVYAELIGYLLPPPTDGFAADYDARFVVKQINRVSREVTCDFSYRPTQASGNEPFWQASLTTDGIELFEMGKERQQWPVTKQNATLTSREYQTGQGNLTLARQDCRDTMSGDVFSWQATLTPDGQTPLTGCATLASLDPSLNSWAGHYIASSTRNQGFVVEMELFPDHSAVTRYVYTNGDRPREERGFWQQLNDDQVYVVMTHHMQQYLVSERIYTRSEKGLTTAKEKINGQIYPLSDGGMTLFPADNIHDDQQLERIPGRTDFQPEVDQAVRRFAAEYGADTEDTRYLWLTYDLNHDGKPELLTLFNWCGNAGCTMAVYEQDDDKQWQATSHMTLVRSPVEVSQDQHQGWQDLILSVKGSEHNHRLRAVNGKYPLNPSTAPALLSEPQREAVLFSGEQSPFDGVKL